MPSIVALILCVVLVAFLLSIERRRNPEASVALWIPTLWLLLCASKPLGRWFDINATRASVAKEEVGSLPDLVVLSALIILSMLIISRRKIQWSLILKDNLWLILLFLYLGSSVLWSDFPMVSFKRWIRLSGAIPIALLVLSERSPFKALESVFRRCAYVLIPASVLLIKYFPDFGVYYSRWDGTTWWVGMASQKNGLGVICTLAALLIIWGFLREWKLGTFLKIKSHAFADGLVLAMALHLLTGFRGVYSATSISLLISGIASLVLLKWMKNNVRQMATLLVLMVALGLICLTFSESMVQIATSVFQRDATFTGRTDIWRLVLEVASQNPFFGVGYGAYWGLQDEMIFSTVGVTEAHSGYLDVYLEGGVVGIVLLLAFLLSYHSKTLRELNGEYDWSLFGICLLIMILLHNFTESNFLRTSSYFWNNAIFLAVNFSSRYQRTRRSDLCPRRTPSYLKSRRP